MAWVPSRVSNVGKTSKHRRIHAMRHVHKNQTGQPWDKPGHDAAGVAELHAAGATALFTASMSCFKVNGFGRKAKSSPSGRFLAKASSA